MEKLDIELIKYFAFVIFSVLVIWLLRIWLEKNKKKKEDAKNKN